MTLVFSEVVYSLKIGLGLNLASGSRFALMAVRRLADRFGLGSIKICEIFGSGSGFLIGFLLIRAIPLSATEVLAELWVLPEGSGSTGGGGKFDSLATLTTSQRSESLGLTVPDQGMGIPIYATIQMNA